MKLAAVRLRNFRAFKTEQTIRIDDLTVVIGRNDAGKSSLLEALDAFFNDKTPDKNDASKGGDAKDVSVTCLFREFPEQLVLDEQAPTSLKEEFLLSPEGYLEVEKVWNCSLEKPKLTQVRVHCLHPTATQLADLWSLKIDALKSRAEELKADLSRSSLKVKSSLRSAIRDHVVVTDTQPTVLLIAGEQCKSENGPVLWKGLQAAMPLFALFKSDRESSDQDPEAQDPLKTAIKAAVKEKQAELDTVFNHVEAEVKKIAETTVAKLHEMDPTLAKSLSPKFEKPKWDGLFKASITGDEDIPLNKRGSGARRVILLNFFRAKAEQQVREREACRTIFAVEEPETSQHPHNQRLLMRALQALVGQDQVLVTTHTPVLARSLEASSLRLIQVKNDGAREVLEGGSEAVNRMAAESLGVLPDQRVKLFIFVEGSTDVMFLKSLATALRRDDVDVLDLDRLELAGEVIFVPVGGTNLAHWVQSGRPDLGRPEFHLYDRDSAPGQPPKNEARVAQLQTRADCDALITNNREIENYLHHDAINEALSSAGYPGLATSPFAGGDDVAKLLLARLNSVAPTHGRWGETRVKRYLAEHAALRMNRLRLMEVDPAGEVIGWFMTMNQRLDAVNRQVAS